ncbi:MAG: 50S ribosomal protein L5 [Candidatus Daviesbacteria bacterium GW2011_GWA2_38_24]|uniref:Large ribosomal subunit protein uL5 n=1 Tax=Candidatus Daviesbacteria bacterium GW2011_GWA2_38_24 TaxID=1618422 RepID=A0A0G0JI87_9BACT|nr:MAG: 50S ribosomal protein L5 [Candidatus Daviesbacteria bacterium GW2011_GWA2_38_24]
MKRMERQEFAENAKRRFKLMNRLKEKYLKEVKPKLKEEFGYKNELAVPSLKKVVVNMGIGEAKDNEGILDKSRVNLTAIAGQKPMVTKAKKSISAFKLTKGQPIGLMVTLRGDKMYSFLDKLINAVLPKVRDFRGVSDVSFDSQGNFNLGLREQTIFPEVDYRNVDKIRGLQVTIATTAPNKEQGKRMLELLGMPFVKE